jgi:hypothetical protein
MSRIIHDRNRYLLELYAHLKNSLNLYFEIKRISPGI